MSQTVELVGDGSLAWLPGLVNAHSHAFHRALRGISETRSGDFWTWRELMYEVAAALDPDTYRELATLVFAEMLLAGWTAVGEFHYVHHREGGRRYDDPNEMTWSVLEAARTAGIRITLLDACYLQAGVAGEPLEGPQQRFGDGDGESWSARVTAAAGAARRWTSDERGPARLGAAVHSVRAVPPPAIETVAAWAAYAGAPLHFHLSEQRKENEACLAAHQATPTDVLGSAGALTRHATAVHATHLTATDVTRIGFPHCGVCACPTTERDLGDGVGPFSDLVDSGAVLSVGSDSHAVIDPFEEMRSLEWHQRLVEERRGVMEVGALLEAATAGGARSLGWSSDEVAGDSVVVRLDRSVALATGAGNGTVRSDAVAARVTFSGAPTDVQTVTVNGVVVVDGGEHITLGPRHEVAARLSRAITVVLE